MKKPLITTKYTRTISLISLLLLVLIGSNLYMKGFAQVANQTGGIENQVDNQTTTADIDDYSTFVGKGGMAAGPGAPVQ
jgi:hypothetical protein